MNPESAEDALPRQAVEKPQRVGRFDWERAIRSAHLAKPASGNRPKASLPLVALTLATYANRDGTRVFPSQGSIAKGQGISVDTVRRALRDLEALGYLVRVAEATPTRATEYVLTLPLAHVPPSPDTEAGTPWDMCQDLPAPVPSDQSSTRSAPEHSPSQIQISPTAEVYREPTRGVGRRADELRSTRRGQTRTQGEGRARSVRPAIREVMMLDQKAVWGRRLRLLGRGSASPSPRPGSTQGLVQADELPPTSPPPSTQDDSRTVAAGEPVTPGGPLAYGEGVIPPPRRGIS